jgi:glycosyl transferase family 87
MPARRYFAWAVLALLLIGLAWRSASDSVDFPVYHQAGRQVLAGDYEIYPAGLYDNVPVSTHGFRYVPALALLFVPFALLPLEAAALLFFALKTAAFVHTFAVVARRLAMPGDCRTLMAISIVVTGGYLVEDFRGGNVQFLIVYLLVLAFDRAERGRVAGPAIALALASAAKVTPLLLAGYLTLRRGPAILVSTVCLIAFLLIAPAVVWGWDHNVHLLRGYARYSAISVQSAELGRNYSLRGVLLRYRPFGISDETASTIWLATVAAAAFAGVMLVRMRGTRSFTPDLELAVILTAIPLLSPHTQRIYFSALAVPVGILAGLLKRDALPFRAGVVTALATTLGASTILPLALGGKRLSRMYLDFSPYSFATLFLLIVLTVVTIEVKRRAGVGEDYGAGTAM